ncbi:phage/plasmid replication domain-containing protein [Marixanthomonas spongiae]|uniref:Replication-associated protein G2P N-terminal domain-containing protein n=1 Tax=Marixanthomonas spongiae TaxID=2174845 RepID=A0A2U0HTJ9_9FLAO|nr:phage/plasmid replication protein [Marixanthomonas spongiae]PVW12168.1 hypothetical protein DDV96_15320 [Marixanthomonas spongiae]
MVDTIRGYIVLNDKDRNRIRNLINDSTLIKNNYGYVTIKNVSNFKITIKFDDKRIPYRLYFQGSLSRFYFGNNFEILSQKEILEAVNALSKKLNIHLKRALLTRVDFCYNIEVKYPVNEYLSCLLNFPRLECQRHPHSVLFYSKYSNSITFYDKVKESIDNHKKTFDILPNGYSEKHIMRYEIRFKSNLKRKFKLKKNLKVRHIYRKSVLGIAKQNSDKYYKKVIKINPTNNCDISDLLNERNGLLLYLSFHGIKKLGYSYIKSIINSHNLTTKNPQVKRSKLINQVNQILIKGNNVALDKDLIGELGLSHKVCKLKK